MASKPAELVLFIIWANGLEHRPRLLRELFDTFSPLLTRVVQWPAEQMRDRLSELYDRPAESLFNKEAETGSGPFTVFVGVDHDPKHTWSKRGKCEANRKAYRIKMRERRQDSNYLHASDAEDDAVAFATRLLGLPEAYFQALKATSIASVPGRPVRDLSHIFEVLNSGGVKYAVMRNWQSLPEGLVPGHGDVDLLVEDVAEVLALFPDIRKKHPDPTRFHWFIPLRRPWYLVKRKNYVRFDFRHIGDGYYDADWQRKMLERRVRGDKGFYHLCGEDHFWALLYHAIMHKPTIRDDYLETLTALGDSESIADWSPALMADPAACWRFLADHVPITRPIDPSVYWNMPA